MKNWILILIFFILNKTVLLACGPFYPYGDDVRFSVLKPTYIPIYGMEKFHYRFYPYSFFSRSLDSLKCIENEENIADWYSFFDKKFTHGAIYQAIYILEPKELKNPKHKNELVRVLQKTEYKEVLNYLLFAKEISILNTRKDPWEKNQGEFQKKRAKQIKKALEGAEKSSNLKLKRRYAYLAIRLAFYNSDPYIIDETYKKYFASSKEKDVLTYWALHFKLQFEKTSLRRNVEIAKVFKNSHEKRFAVQFLYDDSISKEQMLSAALDNEEKSAIEFYSATQRKDQAFEEIKSFQTLSDDENLLTFLVLREINKLEDWILTPHYSLFSHSFSGDEFDLSTINLVKERVKSDRKYAKLLAEWMEKIEIKDNTKKQWWVSMNAYLYFLAEDGQKLDKAKQKLAMSSEDSNLLRFNNMLLALISLHSSKEPNIENQDIQKIIFQEAELRNNTFLFAVARELEYKENTTDAAYIFSKMNLGSSREDESWGDFQFWRSKKLHHTLYADFYEDYFFYLDAAYNPKQMTDLINSIENKQINSDFDIWKKKEIKANLPRLYDLLGTKYIRENDLPMALKSFEKVNDTLWNSNNYPYKFYLGANPFYTDFYTEHKPSKADTIHYTKTEITKKLISYLDKIKSSKGNQKAYYCFQVGNCYLNMTYYGNSWMMRRYFWTTNKFKTGLEDDQEYFQCNLAQKYYLEATKSTKDKEISALALRMVGRCEKYKLYDENQDMEDIDIENYEKIIFDKNQYYKKLKQQFPEHYNPLISNCESFTEYYAKLKSGN